MKQKTIYNLANFISISRAVAAFPLIISFERMHFDDRYYLFSILIILYIFLSDILDGYIARLSDCVTDFGKIIDPIADKICFMVVLIYLIDKGHFGNYYVNLFLLFYVLLMIRDTILITFSLYNIFYYDYVNQANTFGKLFVFFSTLMIIFFIYDINYSIAFILYVVSIIMMVVSAIYYINDLSKRIE